MMRSLYLDDIPGAKPAKRAYDKSLIRHRHEEQIHRFARKPDEKRVLDWYTPHRKPLQPIDKDDDRIFVTKRTLAKSFGQNPLGASRSMALSQSLNPKKEKDPNPQNSSILSGTGKNSLVDSKDPYFPHRYVSDPYGEKYRWTGNRSWVEEPKEMLSMPKSKESYYRRWN